MAAEVKIGARVLDDDVVKKLLPNYENVKKQIEEFRRIAYESNEKIKQQKEEYIKHRKRYDKRLMKELDGLYYNVVSILGSRGTGKTSILLTLKNDFLDDTKMIDDILLPLIVPDHISSFNDTLGWIISYFREVVDHIQQRNKKEYVGEGIFARCDYKNDSELKNMYENLVRAYMYTRKMYKDFSAKYAEGDKEITEDHFKIIKADRDVRERFNEFIDVLVEEKRKLNQNKIDGYNSEPLILMFFDDVDISAEKCPDVLDTVLKFLTHKNIVVFITGDYQIFSEVMAIEFLKKEGLLDGNLMDKDYGLGNSDRAVDMRNERSEEYLRKILPLAFRYNIPDMNDDMKVDFIYYGSKNDEEPKEIEKMSIKELINYNFKRSDGKFTWNDAFSKLLDKTPRGLINVYFMLYQKAKELENEKEIDKVWDVEKIYQFYMILINSNHEFQLNTNFISRYIYKKNDKIIVDYDHLESLLIRYENKEIEDRLFNKIVRDVIELTIYGVLLRKIDQSINGKETCIQIMYSYANLKNPLSIFINKYRTDFEMKLVPEIDEDDLMLSFYCKFIEDNKRIIDLKQMIRESKKDHSIYVEENSK
ncbi:MAG: hypothetical protein N4A62_14005 [Marinisporobacter sp.]|jgi:hypothetical protein|nr:hypothetical protein [Marinisporobacter sp.]